MRSRVRRGRTPRILPLLALAMCGGGTRAEEAVPAPALKEVVIRSTREDLQGVATSASEGIVTSKQLSTRPLQRAGDIMEAVPGLVATQHAGEGKANQYFLRGFNLDHGTDFATHVDGVPVNMPSHGHGQGYTDLNFVIPELVSSVQYRKGPYYAEEGDFAAVGSAHIRTVNRLAQPFGLVEGGRFGYRRLLAAGSVGMGTGNLLLAAERAADGGPWKIAQNLRRSNLFAKFASGTDANGLTGGVMHHEGRWTSTDQVPQRAIDEGRIGRFDSLDPTAGGRTSRTGAHAGWTQSAGGTRTQAHGYALRSTFGLFSNFTYATRGCDAAPLPAPCEGSTAIDQFEQVDRRNVYGLGVSQARDLRIGGVEGALSYGLALRHDDIRALELFDTFQRQRLGTVRSDRVRLTGLGAWTQADLQLHPQWRGLLGLRVDHRNIAVKSSVADNSGRTHATLATPKASLVYARTPATDAYVNWGQGFHSNDARGTVIRVDPRNPALAVERATPLARAIGYEVGVRQKWSGGLVTTAALWVLRLESELLFVGDAGTTEASRPSERKGLELTANWRPLPGWEIDSDLSLARARFRDRHPAGDRIPGAMERVATIGVTYSDGPWTAGARMRHFGSHSLTEDNAVRGKGSTLTNVRVAHRLAKHAELSLDVFNVFDRAVDDIQYAYASRLPGEPPFAGGAPPSLHVHPAAPRSVRVGLKVLF